MEVQGPDGSARTSRSAPKSRVRTGCLVCRARKVKCDEQWPRCRKCTRLNATCGYRTPTRRARLSTPVISDLGYMNCQEDQHSTGTGLDAATSQTGSGGSLIHEQPSSPPRQFDSCVFEALPTSDGVQPDRQSDQRLPPSVDTNASSNPDRADTSCKGDDLNSAVPSSVRFQLTSQVIYLTLATDVLAAPEVSTQASFTYFIEEVDSPILSPFDPLNWTRVKRCIAKLGMQETSVARSIMAVQAIYRAQADRLPMTHAMSVYQAAIASFDFIVGNDAVDFHIVLVIAFLLCLSELTLPNEDGSTFGGLDGVFLTRLETSLLNGHQLPVFLRIGAWLQFLDTAAKRGGSPGLLPEPVSRLLYDHIMEVPSLSVLDCDTHPENALYDIISAPIFTFHLEVQNISNRVAGVTHYRRSRTAPADQAEVANILTSLKAKMSSMWEARPGPLRLPPGELREYFSHTIADPLIAVAGVCLAAYFTEVVAIGRILGDPMFASPEAKQAMKQIREIVEGDWNVSNGDALNPGYLRPLFLYGIESFERDETQWALNRLRQIKNPISRSSFFASFLESHGEAQRDQRRRVTMKYFCYQTFGVPLPFM